MPVASKQQWKLIWATRNEYGSEAQTPKDLKWVWDKEWFHPEGEKDPDWDDLPDKVEDKEEKVEERATLKPYRSLFS